MNHPHASAHPVPRRRRRASAMARAQLQVWDAEGGAPAAAADPLPPPPSDDALLLERLGAAVVSEWNNLPMPLQRALYDRAVAVDTGRGDPAARRDMARYLHDHKGRRAPG